MSAPARRWAACPSRPGTCESCWADLAWLADGSLLVRDKRWDENGERLFSGGRVFSVPDLELIDEWAGPQPTVARISGEVTVAISDEGAARRLVAAPLHGRDARELRVLPTNNASTLVLLPGFDEGAAQQLLGAPAPSPTLTTSPSPAPGELQPGSTSAARSAPLAGLLALAALVAVIGGAWFLVRRRAVSSVDRAPDG